MGITRFRPIPAHRPALILALMLAAAVAPPAAAQAADPVCGNPFANTYGPFDYRVTQGQQLKIVEDYHFTPAVESLIRGVSGTLAGEIDYTLRAFPNHHRALASMLNLSVRMKSDTLKGANFPVECYFKRALTFRPDDQIARMLYAKYLTVKGRPDEATRQLDVIADVVKDEPFTHHNLGLLYLDLKQYDKALAQAHLAIAQGFARPDLKQGLQAAGKWTDPVPAAAAEAASVPAAAASAASAASR